jgi:AICAR transformylase/IMP cyclohydrolase PurH
MLTRMPPGSLCATLKKRLAPSSSTRILRARQSGQQAEEAYRRALACDSTSAFGGIVAFNRPVDVAAARAVVEIFVEVVIAPDFDDDAIQVMKAKKNLRVLRVVQAKRH